MKSAIPARLTAPSIQKLSPMAIIAGCSSFVGIHHSPYSGLCTQYSTTPGLRGKRFPFAPPKIAIRGVEYNRRCCFKPKAAGSQKEPQVNFQAKTEEPSTPTALNSNNPSSGSVLSFLCPLLKMFGGGDPSLPRNDLFEVITSGLASISRLGWGSQALVDVATVREKQGQPMMFLQLYEFEACPFCRRVREALTELDLSTEVYPCPKGSKRHRELVKRAGGKEQFPYLVDPNTGISLYESGDIVKYLFQQYGGGRKPSVGLLESTLFTGWVPTILRAGRGMMLWERAKPELAVKRLELFSYENNQNARLVREALCELELPYILHNVGKGSSKTRSLFDLTGSDMVPYLLDPNTGVRLTNHKDIISYLFQTYCGTAVCTSSQ